VNKLKRNFIILLLFTLTPLYCFSGEVLTNNTNESDSIERRWDFGFGFGFGNSSNPFVGADDIPNYLTLDLSIYGERFFFDNGELGFTIVDKSNFGLNLITTYNTERIYYSFFNELGINLNNTGNDLLFGNNLISRIDLNNSSFINPNQVVPPDLAFLPLGQITLPLTIPSRRYALNLGIEAVADLPIGNISAQLSHDISNAHNGFDLIVDYGKSWHKKRWTFASNVGVHWKSRKLVNYYYGLDYDFNSLFELQYQGQSSLDRYVNLRASYRLTNHVSLVASYKLYLFGSSIRNSPLIVENSKSILFTGLYYRF